MQVKVLMTAILIGLLFCCQTASQDILPDDDIDDRPLSKNCLRCLCKVINAVYKVMGGDPRILPVSLMESCINDTCGVFRITLGYWESAHYRSKATSNRTEYETCSKNAWCAMRTVQRYMRRYLPALQSTRPDRLLCENAVALHKFGSRRGHHNLTTSSRKKLFTCLHRYVFKWLEYDKP